MNVACCVGVERFPSNVKVARRSRISLHSNSNLYALMNVCTCTMHATAGSNQNRLRPVLQSFGCSADGIRQALVTAARAGAAHTPAQHKSVVWTRTSNTCTTFKGSLSTLRCRISLGTSIHLHTNNDSRLHLSNPAQPSGLLHQRHVLICAVLLGGLISYDC